MGKRNKEAWIKATNWLRDVEGVQFIEIADALGIPESKSFNLRRIKGGTNPSDELVERLIKAYPKVKHFFEDARTDDLTLRYLKELELNRELQSALQKCQREKLELLKEIETLKGG